MKKVSSFWLSLAIISQCIKSLIQKLQTVSPVGTCCNGSSNSRRGRMLASRRIVFSDQRTFPVSACALFLCVWWGPLESHIYCWSETSDLLLGTFPRLTRNGRMYFFLSGNHCRLSWKTFLRFHCRCHDCGAILEEYDEETLGLAIVVLSTFIHLSPDLAAPLLLDIMQSVGRWLSASVPCGGKEPYSM